MIYDPATLLQFLVSGIGLGCIYGLIGIGFCVIYNATGIVNFAQGAFVMLGGMTAWALRDLAGIALPLAVALATLAVALVGLAAERIVIRPLWQRGATPFVLILATLAVQVVLENAALHVAGDQPRSLPPFSAGEPLRLFGAAVGRQALWIVGGSLALVAGLAALYRWTLFGKAMRACAVDREMAALLGIPVGRMVAWSFTLSAALGAIGGILVAPSQYTAFNIGVPFAISGFIAAVIGGFGNALGAFLGGIILGVLQALAVVTLGAGYRNIAALGLLLVLLAVRPKGLFRAPVDG
jgi:branched-chain amino acid transport system permease protein